VGTDEREASLPGVIELPERPTVGRVTLLAPRAETAPMNVVFFVASAASGTGDLERLFGVALFAGHCHVESEQREASQIVVEARDR
jgi:hypothetical protein